MICFAGGAAAAAGKNGIINKSARAQPTKPIFELKIRVPAIFGTKSSLKFKKVRKVHLSSKKYASEPKFEFCPKKNSESVCMIFGVNFFALFRI